MLHSKVYNDCLTPELAEAYRLRDRAQLQQLVLEHADLLRAASPEKFQLAAARLQVACALYDATLGGHACCFVTDFVNV
jgi:hypothetical protein